MQRMKRLQEANVHILFYAHSPILVGSIHCFAKSKGEKGKHKKKGKTILRKLKLRVKLRSRVSKTKQDPTQKPCTQKYKDSHPYSFLTTTKQGSSGPCLVFSNSIGAVKRVGETLKVLELRSRMLHAQIKDAAKSSSLSSRVIEPTQLTCCLSGY